MTAPKTILVAEDEKAYARVYELKLKKAGYNVVLAANGDEAFSLAQKKAPDLILLDLVMPSMDGFQVLEALRKDAKTKNVRVIVMSNLGQEEDIAKAKKLGATDFLIKSNVTFQEVLEKVAKLLK